MWNRERAVDERPERAATGPRALALIAALGSSANAARLLARHPRGPAMMHLLMDAADSPVGAAGIRKVLWAELEEFERRLFGAPVGAARDREEGGAAAVRYFVRRRRLSRIGPAAALREPWRRLVMLRGAAASDTCVRIGCTALGHSLDALSADELIETLTPLGRTLGLQVLDARSERDGMFDALFAGVVLQAARDASASRGNVRLASYLGRRVLATLLRRLPESDRRAASRLCASTLVRRLEETPVMSFVRTADIARLERIVVAATRGPRDARAVTA